MSLIHHQKNMGNLKLFDVRPYINLHRYKPCFERLSVDPYIQEGYRRKNIAWFKSLKNGGGLTRINKSVLYQSKEYNPVHGDIARQYPQIVCETRDLERLLDLCLTCCDAPKDVDLDILLQFQRVTATPFQVGKPSVENWHRDGVEKVGVICVGRENVIGGVSEFRNNSGEVLRKELSPGYMVTFTDADIMHRVTEIECHSSEDDGIRDVILFAYYI